MDNIPHDIDTDIDNNVTEEDMRWYLNHLQNLKEIGKVVDMETAFSTMQKQFTETLNIMLVPEEAYSWPKFHSAALGEFQNDLRVFISDLLGFAEECNDIQYLKAGINWAEARVVNLMKRYNCTVKGFIFLPILVGKALDMLIDSGYHINLLIPASRFTYNVDGMLPGDKALIRDQYLPYARTLARINRRRVTIVKYRHFDDIGDLIDRSLDKPDDMSTIVNPAAISKFMRLVIKHELKDILKSELRRTQDTTEFAWIDEEGHVCVKSTVRLGTDRFKRYAYLADIPRAAWNAMCNHGQHAAMLVDHLKQIDDCLTSIMKLLQAYPNDKSIQELCSEVIKCKECIAPIFSHKLSTVNPPKFEFPILKTYYRDKEEE